ncbi:hypothetical protein MTR67_039789 [Solanum verrucosum]|uniref:Uncharacterized protein n=1 Tax=Solanum verrucosum TaxID=315347 RepID=A0AAF0UID9_SOLVR|nr:hypothetical protein MTR67_039789 [Solanum verrucosum]
MCNQKDPNLLQMRWLELLKDYDMGVLYHPSKANVVAHALSRLSMGSVAQIEGDKNELVQDVHRLARLGVHLVDSTKGCVMVHNGLESSFVADVKSKQGLDPTLVELKEAVFKKSVKAFSQGGDGVLSYQGHFCVPNIDDLREQILIPFKDERSQEGDNVTPRNLVGYERDKPTQALTHEQELRSVAGPTPRRFNP